ncbi:MAG: site-specific integrase [Betaproteobacteria bacterium]|nr:site-specific integrase [Betaproteobacteria bacterium]
MAQAKTLNPEDLEKVLNFINTQRHVERNRAMMLLTHWAGLRIGEVAALRWMDVVMPSGQIKDEIRLLSRMTKNQTARTVYVSQRLKEELKRYANQARCIERTYPFFASQKSPLKGFSANSLAQTFAQIYKSAGIEGASSHSGRRTFLTSLANKGTAIHILKTLAGHQSITTTAAYLYSSPAQLRAAVELALPCLPS